ncbi:ADP-heptose:LPS heptosyltransferase [Massilia sp. PDC64]|nr:glycosyltransferase family 9 protein [Massilia sp. PDC64]SDC34784.1 ADP-heptose:LPS heptosyltransferase [Massilia sp. PDC64]
MNVPLIPSDLLKKSDKILFIAHLALGDYTYLQNCFQAFARAYPHLKLHLWVDEVRRTSDASQWPHLKKNVLYDWLDACDFIEKVYKQNYSPELFQASIQEAQQEHYPIVVSLGTLRPHFYADLAREISPDGFVFGLKKPHGLQGLLHWFSYRKLDASLDPDVADRAAAPHISDVHAEWFRQLAGVEIPPAGRIPFVHIPGQFVEGAKARLREWGFDGRQGKLVFINPFAKTRKRCWPVERVAELITTMRAQPEWRDACFIVNAVPQEVDNVKAMLARRQLDRTELFSANENFFQLPAMLAQCDLIVSVETAVMHLANAVGVPVVALMRQKTPEWAPVDKANSTVITADQRRDWVKAIPVDAVMHALA